MNPKPNITVACTANLSRALYTLQSDVGHVYYVVFQPGICGQSPQAENLELKETFNFKFCVTYSFSHSSAKIYLIFFNTFTVKFDAWM